MNQSRRPAQEREPRAPTADPGGLDPSGGLGNAALAAQLATRNGPGDDPEHHERDDRAEAASHPADWGPEGVAHCGLVGSNALESRFRMGVTPEELDLWNGLHVEEHFGPPRLVGTYGADDFVAGADQASLLGVVDLGEEGTFSLDAFGSFVDNHGGLAFDGRGFSMLTPEARAEGVGIAFDQHYTWNGRPLLGSFVVNRQMTWFGPLMDQVRIAVTKTGG